MTTRDEIEQEIDELLIAAYGEGSAHSMLRVMLDPVGKERLHEKASRCSIEKREAKSRLLALLSPARPDGDVTITEEAVDRATRKLWELHHVSLDFDDPRSDKFRELYRRNTREVLAAAHDRPGGEE